MTVMLDQQVDEGLHSVHGAVLAVLHDLVLAEAEVDPHTGCTLHLKMHVRWLGGTWRVKLVLWQYAHGPLGEGLVLTRTCPTLGCQAARHHVAKTLREHGVWLGTNGWQDRQSSSSR